MKSGYLTCEAVVVGLKKDDYKKILMAIKDSPSLADKDRVTLKAAMEINVPIYCKDAVILTSAHGNQTSIKKAPESSF